MDCPWRHGRSPGAVQGASHAAHEIGVGYWTRSSGVEGAHDVRPLDRPQEHLVQIMGVKPANVLTAGSGSSAEETCSEPRQGLDKNALSAKRESYSQQHLAGLGESAASNDFSQRLQVSTLNPLPGDELSSQA